MDKKLYPRIGEEVIWVTLDNGLPVCIVPKKGFSRKYALFATRYGGMDMRFRLNGQWLDTVWLEKALQLCPTQPENMRSWRELEAAKVDQILVSASKRLQMLSKEK